tara:strand:+ start:1271 stop:5116 length:3846 start_codon:yes stop_codon:yes gene_type:complete
MSKDFKLGDEKNIDMYLVLLKYFDGRIENIKNKTIKDLKNGKDKSGEVIEPINKTVYNQLRLILKIKEKNPKEYASINFIYPEWTEKEKHQKLKEMFPNDYQSDPEEDKEDLQEQDKIEDLSDDYRSIIPQRKAFIEWINNVFYKDLIEEYKKNPITTEINDEIKSVNIYQMFVKEYLSIESPFRGLLIYHGLGTGKTATSVITAEGLSKKMKVHTFLPASLETEYIKEVRRWGDIIFNIKKNNWVFYPIDEIKGNTKLRSSIKEKYNIDVSNINSIFNLTKHHLVSKLDSDNKDYKGLVRNINKILTGFKGLYLPSESLSDEQRDIFTTTGKPVLKEGEESKVKCLPLTPEQKIYIEKQITVLIKTKYSFIHYNGFPEVGKFDFKDKTIIDTAPRNTETQRMIIEFAKKYQYNLENHFIESPFREEVIVIDEVHNFVREIMNESAPALVFYNWIINSEDVKIIFLSGTPIINKPAEIAILYNMLRGALLIFNFTIKVDSEESEEDVQTKLRNIFYTERSSIEQLHVKKKKGKLVVSFIKNKTGFESIMEEENVIQTIKNIKYNNHSFQDFFDEIYNGLSELYDKELIMPNQEEINELISKGIQIEDGEKKTMRTLKDLKLGVPLRFDKETNIIFNRKQKLFEINDNDTILDLSDNETFVEYFFDDTLNIPQKKQVLLRRMLLGLTSYYPIDRSSIVDMPTVNKPKLIPEVYENYNIVKNINVVPCYMSSIQWTAYEQQYVKEKLKRLNQLRKKDMYDDQKSDFSIRTRQNSNIVYDDNSFILEKNEDKKYETYGRMLDNGNFTYDRNLKLYSPKFYEIITNLNKLIGEDDTPIGKALYYSDFRHESGSEAFSQILIANGYEEYDHTKKDIRELVSEGSKKKRFTYLTGKESQEIRKLNKDAFNSKENMRGEYIQLILISSAGAEGISLACVRQVHIMEPFWNYIRIDQVFGRAIRIGSHNDLPPDERNVDEYLYVAAIPEGETVEELFKTLKESNWPEISDIDYEENIKLKLIEKHKSIHKTITKMISMKRETQNRTVDQLLFDIMEKKQNISSKISNIIKESSVDCIKNTRDDIQLNEKCLRFSSKLKEENSHFPGLTSHELNELDQKQFTTKFQYFIKPNIYVVIAKKENDDSIAVYYELNKNDISNDMDVRYIRENGTRLCDYDPLKKIFTYYERKDHELNDKISKQFSVFQSLYTVPEYIYENKILKSKFPTINEIINSKNHIGYIIKYNVNGKMFYSPVSKTNIIKLYIINENITIENERPLLIIKGDKVFKTIN